MIKAYLVDDERPAIERLSRMLKATGRVEILGASTDPIDALASLSNIRPDILFLDIRMPELSGFELLAKLPSQPLVVFTTAYDEYALKAFQVNSIDYLVKPIEADQLDRALAKADRFAKGTHDRDVRDIVAEVLTTLDQRRPGARLTHLASRSGNKTKVVDLKQVTHLFAEGGVTFAATLAGAHAIDQTIAELEEKLDPVRFIRIHRGVILNLDYLLELHVGFAGTAIVRLKNPGKTELAVSRARVRELKAKIGL